MNCISCTFTMNSDNLLMLL